MEVSSWQDEMEGFQKMDTSAQKSQFEKTAATIEQALEILEKYAPEKKGMLASLAGRNLSVPRRLTRRCRTRICICRLRMRLSAGENHGGKSCEYSKDEHED